MFGREADEFQSLRIAELSQYAPFSNKIPPSSGGAYSGAKVTMHIVGGHPNAMKPLNRKKDYLESMN